MASISRDPGGLKRILFVAPDGKRKTLRLGKTSMEWAREVKRHVEALLEAKVQQTTPERPTLEWIGRLVPVLRRRLHAVGLIERPAEEEPEAEPTEALGTFLDSFVDRRIDVKPATREVWGQVVRNLKDFFGADRDVATVTEAEADDFKLYLIGEGLASTTVSKRLQFARQFFRWAKKRKLIDSNPFLEVKATAIIGRDKHEVTREDTARIMAVCDPTWQTIVGLCRYGGLRCPSEVLSLRWADILWDQDRMRVASPKTAHHPGHESRECPIFPELKAILERAWELAEVGAVYVVGGGYRKSADSPVGWRSCNLRTQFERIVKRAGLQPWPRLFHAMRSSRETELVKDFPIHVVTAWLGNSPKIAAKHYLMVTEADFQKAAQIPAHSGDNSAQKAAQQGEAVNCTDSQETTQAQGNQGLVRSLAICDDSLPESLAERTGFEPAEPFTGSRV